MSKFIRMESSVQLYRNEELAQEDDGECYSLYEANVKPIVKRGTFEQFLAAYIPNHADDYFYFMLACEHNHLDMAQYIYNNVTELNINGESDEINPLSFAVENCHVDVVRWLLTLEGIDMNCVCGHDYPVLTRAVQMQLPSDIIMRMVDLGARPQEGDSESDLNPLHDALEQNRLDIAMHFLMHDFDPYLYLDYHEMTAFDCEMSPQGESLLVNNRSIMLKYCLDQSGAGISADDFAMIAEFARLEAPEDSKEEEEEEEE
jgi:hypothetical protein